jgi:F0F1-type ATP synthase assembly protein I
MPPTSGTSQAKGGIPGWVLIGCAALVVIVVIAVILVVDQKGQPGISATINAHAYYLANTGFSPGMARRFQHARRRLGPGL